MVMKRKVSPLPTNDMYMHCETFSLMMSPSALSFRDKFAWAQRVGQGEVGGYT